MTSARCRRLAATFAQPLILAVAIAAALPAEVSPAAAGGAQTTRGSSSGEQKASSPSASGAQPSAPGPFAGMETEMFELINRDRAKNPGPAGQPLPPLLWNDQLAAAALAHSRDMIARGYFGHLDPDGHSPGMRLKAAGIAWQAAGENISMETNVKRAESSLMNEPVGRQNHRSNILSPTFTEVGVGIAAGPGGQLYITQDYMKPAANMKDAFPQ